MPALHISERAIVLLAEKCTSLEHLDIVAASQDAAADLLAWPQVRLHQKTLLSIQGLQTARIQHSATGKC